jgi:hypothetical protein
MSKLPNDSKEIKNIVDFVKIGLFQSKNYEIVQT